MADVAQNTSLVHMPRSNTAGQLMRSVRAVRAVNPSVQRVTESVQLIRAVSVIHQLFVTSFL